MNTLLCCRVLLKKVPPFITLINNNNNVPLTYCKLLGDWFSYDYYGFTLGN